MPSILVLEVPGTDPRRTEGCENGKEQGRGKSKGKALRCATRRKGLDASEVQNYSDFPKMGVRGPKVFTMVEKRATAGDDVGRKANKYRKEKSAARGRQRIELGRNMGVSMGAPSVGVAPLKNEPARRV